MIGGREFETMTTAEIEPAATPAAAVDATVSAVTAARIEAATAANTARAYARQWAAFTAWSTRVGRSAMPATDATLAEYVSALMDTGTGVATIEQAISTIRRAHRDTGRPGPDTRAARLVLRTHRRAQADAGIRTRQAPPAAREQLRAMVAAAPPGPLGIRDRALLVLGVAMMGRRSELAALDIADLTEVDEGLVVTVRASKTDQDAIGADVALPYGGHPDTCPVRAVQAWLALLADHAITTGPLLRAVDRHGRISSRPMSGDGINRAVRAAAIRAGLPAAERYSAHSLRAGGATAAAKAGAPVAAIARQGRWSPTSPVVHSYIRAADAWRDNPMTNAL